MSSASSIGHFVSWDGGCLLIGRAGGVIPTHAHYAIQIAFGAEHGIRFRADDRSEWTEYGGAIIASRQPHSMNVTGLSANVVLFVEPETREGRALSERYLDRGIAPLPYDALETPAAELFHTWRERRTERSVIDAAWNVLRALTGGVEPRTVTDERVLRAIAYINAHLGHAITLEEVAGEVFLSPSRFRHLFVEQTGMALRPYILWRRFVHVWELMMAGASLSSAAHAAGFADSAHLTRTSRRMFGIPPSALQFAGPLPKGDVPDTRQPPRSIGAQRGFAP